MSWRLSPVGSGCCVETEQERLDRQDPLVDALAEEAAALVDAVLHVGTQRRLEAVRLLQRELLVRQRRIDRAVEDEPADVPGEEVGVGRADERAVRRPEVVELRLTERSTQDVHVAGDLLGGHVAREIAAVVEAALAEAVEQPVHLVALGTRVRVGIEGEQVVELRRVDALQGVTLANASGVEPDDVVRVGQRGAELEGPGRGVAHPGATGTAGVHDQGPDAMALRRHLEDRELDRRSVGGRVVERDRELAALVAVAVVPGELLAVEARQLGVRVRHGLTRTRRGCGRRGGGLVHRHRRVVAPGRREERCEPHRDHDDAHERDDQPGAAAARRRTRARIAGRLGGWLRGVGHGQSLGGPPSSAALRRRPVERSGRAPPRSPRDARGRLARRDPCGAATR